MSFTNFTVLNVDLQVIDQLDHDILTLKIELEALKKETDKASIDRLAKVCYTFWIVNTIIAVTFIDGSRVLSSSHHN
jgi:hypothetical protein